MTTGIESIHSIAFQNNTSIVTAQRTAELSR